MSRNLHEAPGCGYRRGLPCFSVEVLKVKNTRGLVMGLGLAVLLLTECVLAMPADAQGVNINFVSDRQRGLPLFGTQFTFYDLSTGDITGRVWEFNDGAAPGTYTLQVQTMSGYLSAGTYDIELTVQTGTGSVKGTKTGYIEILPAPFAEFTAPLNERFVDDAPHTVNFQDLSVGGGGHGAVKEWAWDFGNGDTSDEQNPQAPYDEAGSYTVSLTVTFDDDFTDTVEKEDYIVIGEGEDVPSASVEFEDAIRDLECLIPLNDWVPLFHWTMRWDSEEDPAPRDLASLLFNLKAAPDDDAHDPFSGTLGKATDFLQFAIFHEGQHPDDEETSVTKYGELDGSDSIVTDGSGIHLVWDTDGNLWQTGESISSAAFPFFALDFEPVTLPDPIDPENLPAVLSRWGITTSSEGEGYILALRTSATWRSSRAVSHAITDATLVPDLLTEPDDEGKQEPVDSISPLDEEPLVSEAAYLSSFTVWDVTGGTSYARTTWENNYWNWPYNLYTPQAEYVRPRWDVAGTAFDFVAGEWVQLREIMPVEQWIEVVGINLHGTAAPYFYSEARIREVNVIFTDEGGDPLGPMGNGGFDPTDGLETLTAEGWGLAGDWANTAVELCYAFNGVWMYHDTNNNALFDKPTPQSDHVSFSGDYPMEPAYVPVYGEPSQSVSGLGEWEYVDHPPNGGPPWWKMRLNLTGGRRRFSGDTPTGFLEVTPDYDDVTATFEYCDYFIVFRADSGYFDSSQYPGDGVGLRLGADFKTFIEPRRFNANIGFDDGGIYVSSMIPSQSTYDYSDGSQATAWQDDPLWGAYEPWWNERTVNQNSTKIVRTGAEIHDYVITYVTNNVYARATDNYYATGGVSIGIGGSQTWFDAWLDPLGLLQSQFLDGHSVGVWYDPAQVVRVDDNVINWWQFPYETVPFHNPKYDVPPNGPRSSFYTTIPTQPTLPTYDTWPGLLDPGEYPRESQWDPQYRQARYLKQHIEPQSRATPLLGFNFAGADDPRTNLNDGLKLQQLTVAFWGPGFTPSDLLGLDENGTSFSSGVLLVEDTNGDGGFGSVYTPGDELLVDDTVPLDGLAWKTEPQYIDVTGDGVADDMNGDGDVNAADRAWVLTMSLQNTWTVPVVDESGGYTGGLGKAVDKAGDAPVVATAPYWKKSPQRAYATDAAGAVSTKSTKAVGPEGNPGDDLFLVVRTSKKLSRFEQFRAMVPAYAPARLPSEPEGSGEQLAGFEFTPQWPISLTGTYVKAHPEEGAVQEFYGPEPYGHDMLEANIACIFTDLTGTGQNVYPDSGPVAVIGLDVSTNRGNTVGKADSGTAGFGGAGTFSVPGKAWAAGAFTGFFLIDSKYEPFEITGNSAETLFLLSGTPEDGAWFIARDPSFFEQLIVEIYDVDQDGQFSLQQDLLPLSIDQTSSGLALYRDNDFDASNRNGSFDPGIDIPVSLDYAPFQIGQLGEPENQVMFVFSTPGTDDVPIPIENQTRHRQWVPDTLGTGAGDKDYGPDFFVVMRTSLDADIGDDFQMAIVSWGPNTPTEPDPDTWPPPPATQQGEFDLFSEFPWGARAVGFITFFEEETYYAHGFPEPDNSGFPWVRSSVCKSVQTSTIEVAEKVVTPIDVIINSVTPSQIPKTIPAGGLTLTISGSGFGTTPTVVLDGITLTVDSATSTSITATIAGGVTVDSDLDGSIVMSVTNPTSGSIGYYSGFSITTEDPTLTPDIQSISPDRGGSADFPVAILGANFDDPTVYFGTVEMPVSSWTPTRIDVTFPVGGLPKTGATDVTVANGTTGLLDVSVDGFYYVNPPSGSTTSMQCFIATAAYGTPFASHLDTFRGFRDGVLLKSAVGTAAVETYYTISPAIADHIAAHPMLAALVRVVLTPVAWALESPALSALLAGLMGTALLLRRGLTSNRREA
ncbi:MAG: PKD domain-containing protein [Candidatus Hydrogenedentes bacterium]|nr:PKD domain-containing protein [Candidatus Hydrogenedentota bacterium]